MRTVSVSLSVTQFSNALDSKSGIIAGANAFARIEALLFAEKASNGMITDVDVS